MIAAMAPRRTSPGAAPARGIPRELLAQLSCPYCGLALDLETADANGADVLYGVLRCGCCEYPIVEAIPILQQIDGLQRVVSLIRASDERSALLRAMDLFRIQWAHRSRLNRLKYYWSCSRLVSRHDTSFCDAAQVVRRPKVFADYLAHRYANPSFLASIGPILALARSIGEPEAGDPATPRQRSARVLDMCCGAGHASFLMRLANPSVSVVSADQDFVNLYLARRYLVPDGVQLCLDAQVPSPFADRYFDAVYCQDAFHYVHAKKVAIDELKRVARPDAPWMFPHLHNALCENLVPGVPMSPEGYLKCFDLPDARLYSESLLLRQLWSDRAVDLGAVHDGLDEAPNLTMIRGGSDIRRVHRDFPKVFCERAATLRVNPIYRVRRENDGLALDLRWPNPVMARECAEAETVLRQSCRLGAEELSQLATGIAGGQPWLEDLVARFVLVPLPPGYTSRSPIGASGSTFGGESPAGGASRART